MKKLKQKVPCLSKQSSRAYFSIQHFELVLQKELELINKIFWTKLIFLIKEIFMNLKWDVEREIASVIDPSGTHYAALQILLDTL